MVEHLLSKCEVLSSNPRTITTKKKKRKERERERERDRETEREREREREQHISIPLTPDSMTDTIRAQVLHTEPRTLPKNKCMFLSLIST
jgi:septal ring factor EnvC (AmiA/AmiB activator)